MVKRLSFFVLVLIGVTFLSGCDISNTNDNFVDWTKDMHKIGETVGVWEKPRLEDADFYSL